MEPKSEKKGLRADIAKIARRCSESIKMEPEGSQKACREPAKNKQNERKSTREKSTKKQQNCIQNSGQNPSKNDEKKEIQEQNQLTKQKKDLEYAPPGGMPGARGRSPEGVLAGIRLAGLRCRNQMPEDAGI